MRRRERELWVLNDQALQRWWKETEMPLQEFVNVHQVELESAIERTLEETTARLQARRSNMTERREEQQEATRFAFDANAPTAGATAPDATAHYRRLGLDPWEGCGCPSWIDARSITMDWYGVASITGKEGLLEGWRDVMAKALVELGEEPGYAAAKAAHGHAETMLPYSASMLLGSAPTGRCWNCRWDEPWNEGCGHPEIETCLEATQGCGDEAPCPLWEGRTEEP